MKRSAFLSLFYLVALCIPSFGQCQGWTVALQLEKSEYLPAEPIPAVLRAMNPGPAALPFYGFLGQYYLDGESKPCFVQQVAVDFPPKGESQESGFSTEPVGTVHSINGDLAWWCQLAPRTSSLYGPHTICYRAPAFKGQPAIESCVSFTLLHPTGEDARAYEHYKGDPLKGKDLVERFPTSNYSALALWQEGLKWYEGGVMNEATAEKDFHYRQALTKALGSDRVSIAQIPLDIAQVSDPWIILYERFPSFGYRARLLFGLTRCYFRLAEYQRVVPLLQELLTKFPDSEWTKKSAAYKEVLQAYGKWPE